MFRLSLVPKEAKFFDLFESASANLIQASLEFKAIVSRDELSAEEMKRINQFEHEGDAVTHKIFAELHRTFITPLEREDIVSLTHSLDDVLDFVDKTVDYMLLYRVRRPTATVRRMADIVAEICEQINEALPLLRRKETMPRVLPITVRINSLENEADDVMREGLSELLDAPESPEYVMEFVRWRDIYEALESATDRGEDVANALEAIILKSG